MRSWDAAAPSPLHPALMHPAAAAPQYIFGLTMDVDGFPGGPLWRSDAAGRADSWRDASAQVAASLPAEVCRQWFDGWMDYWGRGGEGGVMVARLRILSC